MKRRLLFTQKCRRLFALSILIISFIGGCSQRSSDPLEHFAGEPAFKTAMSFYDKAAFDSAAYHFNILTSKHPNDPFAWAWLAKAVSYDGDPDTCLAYVRKALSLDPRNALALVLYANCYNPQFRSVRGANYDTTWHWLQKAVESDPNNGDAWIGIYIEAMRRGDIAYMRTALSRLKESGFLTPSVLELNRWMLRNLPPDAILITSGDMDTFPSEALQLLENARPDVAIVNWSMLNMPWYAGAIAKRYNLLLPIPADSLENYWNDIHAFSRMTSIPVLLLNPKHKAHAEDAYASCSISEEDRIANEMLIPSVGIIQWWLIQNRLGGLKRQVVFSALCASDLVNFGPSIVRPVIDCGAYRRTASTSDTLPDWEAMRRSFLDADGRRFVGKAVAKSDLSAYRRCLPEDFAGAIPYAAGKRYVDYLRAKIDTGTMNTDEQKKLQHDVDLITTKLEQFALAAGLNASIRRK